MSPLAAWTDRLGFDAPRLRFTLRTAVASVLALVVAALAGIDNPQWAAMTVWVVAQPTRGQLLEKGAFRIAGTLVGAGVGMALILASGGSPPLVVAGLAAWIGLCAGAGNLLGGFIGYGTLLAGYSAAMVALVDVGHPAHIQALALDRVLTICIGVAMALLVGWLFTPAGAESELAGRVRRLTARGLRHLATGLDTADLPRFRAEEQAIVSEMAAIDEGLDAYAAGSARNRQRVHRVRAVLAALLGALVLARGRAGTKPESASAQAASPLAASPLAALRTTAAALEGSGEAAPDLVPLADLASAPALKAADPALHHTLQALARASADLIRPAAGPSAEPDDPQLLLHRDVAGARIAALRAGGAVLVVGLLWLATGWSQGPFMLLGAAIMTSLFSTFDNPALTMRFVLGGSLLGAAAALLARCVVLPHAGSLVEVLALSAPFVLAGAFVMAHRATLLAGMDYNMSLLLLLQPAFPLHGTPASMVQMAIAMLLGPLIALVAFRLVYPMDARRRRDLLVGMMVRELAAMARSAFGAQDAARWRARLYHRLLRLVRWNEKCGEAGSTAVDGGLAALAVGTAIRTLHEQRAAPGRPDSLRRSLDAALTRATRIANAPERVADAFERAAVRLDRASSEGAGELRRAAAALRAHAGFFMLEPPAAA